MSEAETVTVTVLQDDIDNGLRANPVLCAVARAACRELSLTSCQVGSRFVVGTREDGSVVSWDQPPEVTEFVVAFDHDEPVEPFKFEAELRKVAQR